MIAAQFTADGFEARLYLPDVDARFQSPDDAERVANRICNFIGALSFRHPDVGPRRKWKIRREHADHCKCLGAPAQCRTGQTAELYGRADNFRIRAEMIAPQPITQQSEW